MTLAQMRDLKTHGEKRVSVVLEVFHTIHEMMGNIDPQGDLAVRTGTADDRSRGGMDGGGARAVVSSIATKRFSNA